jgi:hypothetical protein
LSKNVYITDSLNYCDTVSRGGKRELFSLYESGKSEFLSLDGRGLR